MNEIQIFQNQEFGAIRTISNEQGEALFCAKDVAEALGYRRSNDAVRVHVEPEDAVKRSTPTTSGNQYKVQGSADLPNPFPRYLPAKRQG